MSSYSPRNPDAERAKSVLVDSNMTVKLFRLELCGTVQTSSLPKKLTAPPGFAYDLQQFSMWTNTLHSSRQIAAAGKGAFHLAFTQW